jgi:RsiW-degrading membrane proteinase PrsW (M82 family)
VIATLRWMLLAAVPAAFFVALVRRTDPRREPHWLVATTFLLGAVAAVAALFVTSRATALTGLDMQVSDTGESGALVFLFLVVAPLQEAAKVAAAWPAFLSKHIDEEYDGVVYAAASALGFAAVESGAVLRAHPAGLVWVARALLALPAHVFFACLWGYALGLTRQSRRQRLPVFPIAFVMAIASHGLYAHFVYGRGPGALLVVTPLLAGMGFVAAMLWRDLLSRRKVDRPALPSVSGSRRSFLPAPPSLSAVRSALARADQPVKMRWIVFGALVTLGAMIVGIAAGVVAAHALHVDLASVDEKEIRSAAPALLLGAGLLGSFPTSGWLIARAAGVQTLLEPALACVLALTITLVALGFAAPFTLVFGLALAPIAWILSCAGAWVGR